MGWPTERKCHFKRKRAQCVCCQYPCETSWESTIVSHNTICLDGRRCAYWGGSNGVLEWMAIPKSKSKLCMRRFRVTAPQQINIRDLGLPYNWGWVLVRWTKHIACEWFFLSLIALSYFSFHRGFLAPIVFH